MLLIRTLRLILRFFYGFHAFNEDVLRTKGPVLLLSNHVSWWDWLFIGSCLEEDWKFVTSSVTAKLSWLHRFVMVNRRTFPVDMNSPYAMKHIAEYLQRGGRLVLFPEGRMSTTGSLMKLFEGTGFLVAKTHAKVIAGYLRGAGRLPFSRNPNRKQWFPRVSVHFSDLLTAPKTAHAASMEARITVTNWLRDQMLRQQFDAEMALGPSTIFKAIQATARKKRRRTAVQDASLQELTYGRLLEGAAVLEAQWRSLLPDNKSRVGVLLPNVNAFPVVLLSLWMGNKVPAILNYTTGSGTLGDCARLAQLESVITSKQFLQRSQLDLHPLQKAGVQLVFLEDVRARISKWDRLRGVLRARLTRALQRGSPNPEDAALVLFTSGSESEPKGVELTHRNILANVRQMLAVVDLMETDRFFNALPLFHSFGLTVGLILPLMQGNFVFLYISPLHYRVVPAALYNANATVFFGTNTFLSAYARKAHPYDFHTVRYVFAGAEKLTENTSNLWLQKFGVRILEGYGATECSPCLTVNVPMQSRPGSAGRFLPTIEYKLEPVEGLEPTGSALDHPTSSLTSHSALPTAPHSALPTGRLYVRGPNIMRGYLNPQANVQFQSLQGWYDTGDIARVDSDGFVFLLGRLRRFAKVSGEMVSLTAVEEVLSGAFPQFGSRFSLAAISRADKAKGEKIVLVTNEPKLTLTHVREVIQDRGLGNLAVPREIVLLPHLPLLGTGKVNHRELQRLFEDKGVPPDKS
jgi:acyl-[acyl-carrier-protein]-phospholipid O-acyltransferase/long-chain-fatty-acid--[acyl-carrier-protein] ligase